MNASNTPKITLGFGIALIVLALAFFGITGSTTALIPVGIGLPIALCGLIAFKAGQAPPAAAIEIVLMGVISAVFIALGVRSFINARKARAAEAEARA